MVQITLLCRNLPMLPFALQFSMTLLMYVLVAKWWVGPALDRRDVHEALAMLCAFHGLRSLGMGLMAPGAVDPSIPMSFRQMTAFGDYLSGALGLLSAVLLMRRARGSRAVCWVFSVVGIVDLLTAVVHGSMIQVFERPLGAGWYSVTVYVPAAYVTHAMIVRRLLRAPPR